MTMENNAKINDTCPLCGMSLANDHNGMFFGNCVGNSNLTWVVSDELLAEMKEAVSEDDKIEH